MPDPILDLVLKRKAAKERINMRSVQVPAPGFVPVMADDNINDQFQIEQIDTEIKGMGFDPVKVEEKVGDLPSYIPNHIVSDILNIEDPIELKRKKAATKWQGTLFNRVNNIPDPAEREKGIESFNFLIKGYTGSGKPNYESTVNGIRAAKEAINASLQGDERQEALNNLKYDAGFGLAQTLLQDQGAQMRWKDMGLNPVQGLALDMKEMFDPTGVEFKKQVTGKFQDPLAQAEQRVKLAELENDGINILGEEINYLIGKKSNGVKKANDFYTQNQPRIQELKSEIEKDQALTQEQKQRILGFQQEYDDVLMGKDDGVFSSPFAFEQLKEAIDKGTASPLQIREYNKRVEKLNGIAGKYKQELEQYNQTAGAQSAAAREFDKIVNTIQENLKETSSYNNLGAWADYLAKQKNSQAERFPEFSQIQIEQLVQDVAGANLGAGSRFVYNLANATGGEAINGLNKLWNNLTLSGDALREAEMGDAYRSRVEEAMMTYETKDQALKERAVIPVVGKQTQDKLAAIDASDATPEAKYQQKYKVIEEGFNSKDISYAANPKFGKLNLTSASIVNTASAVTSQLIGQLAQAYATGGIGNASKVRQLSTLFGTTFAQTFGRSYDQAVREGRANPFQYAVTQSSIEALSELPFNNLAMVEKLMPSVRKFAGDLSDVQWKALIAGKVPSNLGREVAKTAEGLAIEGALEEGLAGVGSNLADRMLFGGNKELFEDVDTQVLAGVIGFAPMSALGLPMRYRSANMGDKLMMYHAGYKADNIIKAINQQLADGTISQQEATERIEAAKQMKAVIGKMPMYDANGKPLSDYQKAQYAWNEYTKIKANDSANLPTQQQEELKQLSAEADQSSSNILNGTEDATPKSTQQEGLAEGNLVQPQGAVQGQQEIGEGTGAERQGQIPQANVSYSDISGQEIEINETPQGLTDIAAKVMSDAFQTAKSLATAGIKVRVFQNQEDFERASAEIGQQARGQGVFAADGKNILINLSQIKSVNDWGIVWHEGAHPVMNTIRNTNPELYNTMAKGFGSLAKQGGAFAQVEGWAASEYGEKNDVSTDEAMVETVSLMADGRIKLADIPTSFRQQVIDFVNQVAEFLGLGQLADTSERVFVQKAAQIANALRSGEDISSVVGAENVTRTTLGSFVGQEKKGAVKDNTPKPRDFKAAEQEVTQLIQEQSTQPEAVLIVPQRDKDGKLKISVDFDEDGNRVVEVKYKQAPYDLKKGALQYVDQNEEQAIEKLSDITVADYRANEARPEIAAGIGWYSKMRQRFQKYFGANIETFGQLLAATSARTGVFDNFKQSVEAFKLFSQGRYNELLKDYDNFVKDIQSKTDDQLFQEWTAENPTKRPREFDAREYRTKRINRYENVPLKANGKKYNANSKKVLQALYGNWLQQTEGPKTKNFAGNLTGRSFGPTIDVWAARYLRRAIYQGKVDRWRIPPSLEKGVDYSILVSGEMSGDYPFAEKVMQRAADKLGINADDLQAFLWYLEKDVWDKNGWTNKAGAEKASFEQGADTLDTERYQAGVTTFKDADTFDPVVFEQERVALEAEIGKLPGVVAARVTESVGEFYSDTGVYIEPTFDVEFTMDRGSDVTPVREKVNELLKKYNQDATLFSKIVDRENPNARPILEIGLSEPAEKSQIIDDIKAILAEDNVRGFTIAKDSRGRILGVRSQFVPEFENEGVSMEDGIGRFSNAFTKIKERYGKDRNISYIAAGYVDTEVKFQEDGKESQQDGRADGEESAMGGERQQPAAGSLPGQQPESGGDNQGGLGDAGGMGQEPGTGQQRRSSPFTDVVNGFYSPIEDRVNVFKQPKASAQKWKEIVGVKSDEAIYSGLADWLNSQDPAKQLSKEDVLEFMKDNRIEIKEVNRGGDYLVYDLGTEEPIEYFETLDEARDFIADSEEGYKYDIEEPSQYLKTRYEEYQLPGGKNYKEVLVTLPINNSMTLLRALRESETLNYARDTYGMKSGEYDSAKRATMSSLEDRGVPYERILELFKAYESAPDVIQFKSNHFEEPNILVHLRMNTRTDADGKKVLFLEEIQSDWGQKGRDDGFKSNDKNLQAQYDDVYRKSRDAEGKLNRAMREYREENPNTSINSAIEAGAKNIEDLHNEYRRLEDIRVGMLSSVRKLSEGVAPAPFVTNTNAWVKLGLKVALKEALRQGTDRIAWTTGEQQNERYDLRKQVDEITYRKLDDGNYRIVTYKDFNASERQDIPERGLEDALGKDIAERIINGVGYTNPDTGVTSLTGLDLKVGGKGMKAFYGDAQNPGIVANVAKALVKELTGKEGNIIASNISVAEEDVDTVGNLSKEQADQYKADGWNIFKEGDSWSAIRPTVTGSDIKTQPAIDITNEVASSVKEGMPQFKNSSVTLVNDAIQERKSAAKITGKALESIKDQIVKLGYGYLPDDVNDRLKKKQRLIDADINEMNVLNRRFETAVRESYGTKYKNLSEAQKEQLDFALRNFEGITSLKDKDMLRAAIPGEVLEIIDQMRFHVDGMSKKLVDLGIMDSSLEPAFDGDKGLGVYLTRTYRKYDDPEWVKNVPDLVKARAKTYLAINNSITEIDAQGNLIERPLTDEELDGLVNYIASNTDPVMDGLNAANAGKVKVDILKGRKVIPEEIRDLMGEYKDPSVNFAKSIAKMATLIHTHQALKDIASENIGTLFFREPQGDFFVPVAGKDAAALQPLSGLYSTREIADAFKEVQATFEGDDWNLLALRTLAWINGAVKIGKTALSPASWVRNVIGGHIIMLKDGHIGGKGYADGWQSAFGYFFNKEKDSPEFQAKMREYIEQGIMGDGVAAGEFQAIVKAAYGSENPLEYIKKDTALGRFTDGVKGFYSAQDDIFRIWAYENEKARLIQRKPNMSVAEVQAEASRKARATYPTYSELPEVVRKLAKFIPISSFPAFSAELIRTTKNSVSIALEEMKDPDMRDVGILRMAGVVAAIGFGTVISAASSMLVGIDDEEEKSLRRFLPEWSKNSQLIWLGRDENGMPKYIDLGFSDPFSYFKKPFVAFFSDKDNISDRAKDAVKEATAPFVSPEIFLSALVKGNKVVNESDDMDEVIGKYAGPIYEAVEPGIVASTRRILKGVMGDVDRYGQQYDAGLEATAFFTGQRIKKFDVSVGFGFKAKEFNKRRTESLDAYYMEKSKTVKDEAALDAEITDAEDKFQDYYNEFKKDYDAAMYLMTQNMSAREASKILDATMKDRNVPEMFRKSIKQNKPYPGIMKKDK